MAKKRFTILVDEQIIKDFRYYCKKNALKFSAKIELLLKKEMENKKDSVDSEIAMLLKQLIQQKPMESMRFEQRAEPRQVFRQIRAQPVRHNPKIIISEKPVPSIAQLVARRRRI